MATVQADSGALRFSTIAIGNEFNIPAAYSTETNAYFFRTNAYNTLTGISFEETGPAVIPSSGNITGWEKISYPSTPLYAFSDISVDFDDWMADATANSPTFQNLLAGADTINGGGLDDELWGFTGNDTINGGDGNDTLNGGTGSDAMTGGAGDDTYVVDATGDAVTEALNGGTDTVQSSITLTLGANVENLTLTGTDAINGTGNTLDNALTGNALDNALTGGAGSDTYVVDATDTVTENASEGTDTIESATASTLGANVENLTLTGSDDIDGTGNALKNLLTGNSGTNELAGGAGNDTYVVQNAEDTVTENANEGTDTVQSAIAFTLGANVENFELTGTAAIDGTGNALDNTLTGNSGANRLDGGGGADILIGGAGNDVYVVDATTDVVTEAANAGTDTIESAITFDLSVNSDNVENLTLTGSVNINATGSALNNVLTGNSGANRLDGGVGTDTMIGGAGDDTYVVDTTTDVMTEAVNAGTDTVQSSVTLTLNTNVENLELTGAGAINGTGNTLNNTLTGNSGNNTLTGGAGIDTFAFAAGFGNDMVADFSTTGGDRMSLRTDLGVTNFASLDTNSNRTLDDSDNLVAITNGDTVITFAGGEVLTVDNVTNLDTSDFLFV